MANLSGIIGRALSETATMAAPFVMEDMRSKALAKRDARLQQFQQQNMAAQQQFATQQQAAGFKHAEGMAATGHQQALEMEAGRRAHAERLQASGQVHAESMQGARLEHDTETIKTRQSFEALQNDLNRKLQSARDEAQYDYHSEQIRISEEELSLKRTAQENEKARNDKLLEHAERRLNMDSTGHKVKLLMDSIDMEVKYEDLKKTKKFNRLVNMLSDPNLKPAERAAVNDYLDFSTGNNKITVQQMRDEHGFFTDEWVIHRGATRVNTAQEPAPGLIGGAMSAPGAPAAPEAPEQPDYWEQLFGGAQQSVRQQADPSTAAGTYATPAIEVNPNAPLGSRDNPHQPLTAADFAKVRPGEIYIHPENGKPYRKPSG